MPVTSYSRSRSWSSGHPARRRAKSMINLRVVLSFQSRVSGTASFSALMAASRSRSASSSPSTSLRASSAASSRRLRASSSSTLAGAAAGSWVGTRDSSKVFPLIKALRPLPQIGAARPVEDVRQLPHDVQRLLRRGGPVAVHRHVAGLPDVLRLPPHDLGHDRAEGRLVEVGVQIRDLRWAQGLLDPVDALDQALQRMPRMEAGGPRVTVDVALRMARALRRMRNSCFRKAKLAEVSMAAQRSPRKARDCREAKRVSSSAR